MNLVSTQVAQKSIKTVLSDRFLDRVHTSFTHCSFVKRGGTKKLGVTNFKRGLS
jgi:hypothetical protein